MMGVTHATQGALAFAVAVPLLAPIGVHLDAGQVILGTLLTAGAAVLPDIDHPGSGISRTFGPITRPFAWWIEKVSGGHRNGTHSFLGVAIVTFLAFTMTGLYVGDFWMALTGPAIATMLTAAGYGVAAADTSKGKGKPAYKKAWHGPAALLNLGAVAFALLISVLLLRWLAGALVLGALVTLVMAAAVRVLKIKGQWDDIAPIPAAVLLVFPHVHVGTVHFASPIHISLTVVPWTVLLGTLVHIAGDMCTHGGCPLGWPWSQTYFGPRLFTTNSWTERVPVRIGCVAALVAALAWNATLLIPGTR